MFPPRIPETSQFTAALLVLDTVALNCCGWFTCRLALVGVIETDTGSGAVIETVALAVAEVCAALCAVTVIAPPEGTAEGAV